MKIICVQDNYKKDLSQEKEIDKLFPSIYFKPDSALLTNGKPFFIPDFAFDSCKIGAHLVVKINRLGRSIPLQFASRYYEEATIGVTFTAVKELKRLQMMQAPIDLSRGFDYSAVIGDFCKVSELGNINKLDLTLKQNENPIQQGNTNHLFHKIDEIITYVSQYITLKQGDLIFTGELPNDYFVKIGDQIVGEIENKQLLKFKIC